MKLYKMPSLKIVAVCLALSFMVAPLLLPAIASASGGGTVDVCNGGTNCNQFVNDYVNPAVKALTALVGIAAVLSIIIAGIQYSSSADDPGVVTKAKQRVFNVVLGLLAYIFLVAFLNFLIPGGIW